MTKFRYYIQDPFEGAVTGTDSEEKARNYASAEDFAVIDTETGKWLGTFGAEFDQDIQEAK